MSLVLKGGLLVDPYEEYERVRDIFVDDEGLLHIYDDIEAEYPDYKRFNPDIYDCSNKIIGPGLVDVHVHFRDPGFEYKEDIETGARAAARGGFTDVVMMANTNPTIDSVETLEYVLNKGKKTGINVHSCASITKGLKGKELVDFDALSKAGAIGFTDDGIPILEEEIVRKAMEISAEKGYILSFHEENPKYIENNGVNRGLASKHYGIGGSDRQAEIDMVKRDLDLALETGARINIQHVSTKEAVQLIREAKKRTGKNNIYAEVTPHHLALTEEAVIKFGTNAKMNPPLRTEEDRLALIEGIFDGTIDCVATDHAPHAKFEKDKAITDAPSGIIGLETSLKVSYDILVRKHNMTLLQLFCKMSKNPAEFYKIDAGKLAIGRHANLIVFDADKIQKTDVFCSKSANSPFKNTDITGDVEMTICKGAIVYNNLTIQ